MPKDATKNVDRYKIRGGQLNEFEYTQNQKAVAGNKAKGGSQLIPGTRPEEAGEGLQPGAKAETSKATKGTKSTKANSAKKANNPASKAASAKKPASKGAKKSGKTAAKQRAAAKKK